MSHTEMEGPLSCVVTGHHGSIAASLLPERFKPKSVEERFKPKSVERFKPKSVAPPFEADPMMFFSTFDSETVEVQTN